MKQLNQINSNFTAVPNEILLDINLTEKEKILYIYLLSKLTQSKPEIKMISINSRRWIFYYETISKDLNIDVKTLKNRLKNLEQKKYIKINYEDKQFFGKTKGFRIDLFFQNNDYRRTGLKKEDRENISDETIKRLYRNNCIKLEIKKKSLLYPTQIQWKMIFKQMGNYKYLIPYIPFYFQYIKEYFDSDEEMITFQWLFSEAFEDQYKMIDFLLRHKKYEELRRKYPNEAETIIAMLEEMRKEDNLKKNQSDYFYYDDEELDEWI